MLLLVPKHNLWGKLGLSYLLGVGIFTLLIYVTNLIGLKITALNLVLLFLASSVSLVTFKRKSIINFKSEILASARLEKIDFVDKFLLGGIAFFIISSFLNTLYWPVFKWDSLTLYDFRAHVFIETGFIKEALTSLGSSFYFGYPLLTSLLHTIIYILGGSNPKFIYSLFYLSLGLIFYGQLRELISRKLSLLFTLMLLTIPQIFEQSLVSYTNLAYTSYFSLGAIYYFLWDKKKEIGYLVISAILVGLSTWTRSAEAFWLTILAVVIVTSILRKRYLFIIVFSLIFFPIQQVWKYFTAITSSKSTTLDDVVTYASRLMNVIDLAKWKEIVTFLYYNVILNWGSVFLLFLTGFIYAIFYKKEKDVFLIYFTLWCFW